MKKDLAFRVPFSGFTTADFINCFASIYLFLENMTGDDHYNCKVKKGEPCDGCGNHLQSLAGVQEDVFFLFDTMCGHSSLRYRFDGEPTEMQKMIGENTDDDSGTDYTVGFLFGFAGYEYRKLTAPSEFKAAILASIDTEKPVIAKVKAGRGRFRVITGYDGDTLICPDFAGAQHKPEGAPAYDELEIVYIIGEKITPRYTLIDGLERIRRVMEYNISENLWGGYTGKMGWYDPDGLGKTDLEEKKTRMKRVADTMWHTFNSHNFAEVFRHRKYTELKNPAFDEIFQKIGGPCYGYTHDLAWALIDLEKQIDWSALINGACGIGEMVQLTLYKIRDNDIQVLDAVKQAITILKPEN